ncbi:MAG: phytanoyl-CoA dioxygenase family protein [Opitutales bacterium]
MIQLATLSPDTLQELKRSFEENGFCIARGVFSPEEVSEIKDLFEGLHEQGPIPKYYEPMSAEEAGDDILKTRPRFMHPHRYSDTARRYMLHPKVTRILKELFGHPPLAAQSMFYQKPPGAKGQDMHQDQFYLLVEPGTCIAAWTAIDDADPKNGGMHLVPGSHNTEVVCPENTANPNESFTNHHVRVPRGYKTEPAIMSAGDVLFFNGSVIHGSGKNRTADRWRRSFICHYVSEMTEKLSYAYLPLIGMDGSEVTREANQGGGPCGADWQGATH